ncbi:MAG: ribosome biogenesis GTPase Der, partial [Spirochaetae bacterium HGW-Spirochaetae-9]
MSHGDTTFTISDTPGLDLTDSSALSKSIIDVAHRQLERSSLIVLILENPAPAPFDYEMMNIIRKLSKPVIVAVNKMDNDEDMRNIAHFYEMGLDEIIPISALRRRNIRLLLDKITEQLTKKGTPAGEPDIRIAIVGRPNSGKSTLLNAFIGYERSVVSDVPGTTRDSVDEDFHFQGKLIRLTDTAGLRRRSRVDEDIEFYSVTRTMEAITRADTVIHLI